MCISKFSIELNTFGIDDKGLTTNNIVISVKRMQIFKMDDSSVSHQPVYVSFLDDSSVHHPPGKVLIVGMIQNTAILNFSVNLWGSSLN